MIERIIILDGVDPVLFYGVNNSNIQLVKNLFPKLRLVARGNVLKVMGDELETAIFEEKIQQLIAYCEEHNTLNEEAIIAIIKGEAPKAMQRDEDLIIYGDGWYTCPEILDEFD